MSEPNPASPFYIGIQRKEVTIHEQSDFEMFEPGQLKRLSSGVYCTNEHDSLKMSNGKWFWWSRGVGGKNAIDFLMKCDKTAFRTRCCCLPGA